MKPTSDQGLSAEQIQAAIATLETLLTNNELWADLSEDQRIQLISAAGRLSRPSKDEINKRNKDIDRAKRGKIAKADRRARALTGIREARTNSVFVAPKQVAAIEGRTLSVDRENQGPSAFDEAFDAKATGEAPTIDLDRDAAGAQQRVTQKPRNCYVCKAEFTKLHHFYDSMCMPCAELNYKKRFQLARLDGQVALITGSRLKIGYHATLMMLRSGARVIATTRFPVDSALRFSKEEDYEQWKDRLDIYGLDLRHTPSVEIFARYIEQNYDRLDILINNAAQTVRRPPGFYAHMMPNERKTLGELPEAAQHLLRTHSRCNAQLQALSSTGAATDSSLPVAWHGTGPGIGLRASAELSQIPYSYDNSLQAAEVFPEGKLDVDLQQVDLRATNSWRLKLADVPTPELLEVQLVNAIAPFVLCSRLAPLMRRDYTGQKHIVNVTAMEGKFYRFKKQDRHPHTNMAKAALNMLVHTSASDLEKDGIFMNAVDTGWVTDEDPAQMSAAKQATHDFQPPLDIVDGAARVCDPFIDGILTGKHWSGKFLKDYFPIDW